VARAAELSVRFPFYALGNDVWFAVFLTNVVDSDYVRMIQSGSNSHPVRDGPAPFRLPPSNDRSSYLPMYLRVPDKNVKALLS